LSGGQSDIDSTAHLDKMNKISSTPWKLSFSYGRALQQAALKAWSGNVENETAAQETFSHRAKMNKLAALGEWESSLEN
jgi:fructose-bisphosphate aldolase class I